MQPAKNQQTFAFDRRDRFRFLRGADFGDPAEFGRKNFAGLKKLIEIIELKTLGDGGSYLTQQEFAEAWGVSVRTVSRWIKTGVRLGVIHVEERIDRGGQRANRTSIDWSKIRSYAYGGANPIDLGLSRNGSPGPTTADHQNDNTESIRPHDDRPVRHDDRPVRHDDRRSKEDIRLTDPNNNPPHTPPKPSRTAQDAWTGAAAALYETGVRNVTRALHAARRRGMTPDDVVGIVAEATARRDDFEDLGAVVVARLVDLDELPPESPAARRRKQEHARQRRIAAQAEQERAQAEQRQQRRRKASGRPQWHELPDDERRRRIESIRESFPNTSPRMLEQFARSQYITEIGKQTANV